MATIKFQPIGSKSSVPIYLRFSISREINFRVKSGYTINPKNWSVKTGLPKQTSPELKNLKTDLEALRLTLLGKCNEATTNGTDIDMGWAKDQIDIIHGKSQKSDLDRLTSYFDYYIGNLPNKVLKGGNKGVASSTLKSYRKLKHKIEDFEKHQNTKYLVKDVDLKFRDDFVAYMKNVEALSDNYAGRLLKALKTVCLDAKKHGIEVSFQLSQIQGYTIEVDRVYLTLEEIERIDRKQYRADYLENAKDWLVIGCFLGQRVSDLLKLTKNDITVLNNGVKIISLTQKKTGKRIALPILPKVDEVLGRRQGEFPRKISDQKFNDYIKEVARIAGLETSTKGSVGQKIEHNDELKYRQVKGIYPKWKLVTSHICRRSFATNLYGTMPTPIIMSATGHSTEKQFLEYIGMTEMDSAMQMAEYWAKASMAGKNEPQLNVVKKAQ